jgi:hypothetical protein
METSWRDIISQFTGKPVYLRTGLFLNEALVGKVTDLRSKYLRVGKTNWKDFMFKSYWIHGDFIRTDSTRIYLECNEYEFPRLKHYRLEIKDSLSDDDLIAFWNERSNNFRKDFAEFIAAGKNTRDSIFREYQEAEERRQALIARVDSYNKRYGRRCDRCRNLIVMSFVADDPQTVSCQVCGKIECCLCRSPFQRGCTWCYGTVISLSDE